MKRTPVIAAVVVAFLLCSGCATVKVFSDAGLKNETGLRFYTLKPYLLVEYNADKDNTVKTTVVYLPDLSSPQFMRVKSGIGASEVKMGFKNSALESYGVVADSKLPEGMEAFAAVLSKSAYATQTLSSAASAKEDFSLPEDIPFRLYEIIITPSGTELKEVGL